MKMNALRPFAASREATAPMPVLFLGHGSPMNAIEENVFTANFQKLGHELDTPKAILCISAHWETRGTMVTARRQPPTIHDFRGFPRELSEVQYPAPGSPELAETVKGMVHSGDVALDHKWGLDHGAWSVIKHLYPKADVPVIQLSLDYTKSPREHLELALELALLRTKGVLVIGSGNIVHNLGLVAWDKVAGEPFAYDWAAQANQRMKELVLDGDLATLADFGKQGRAFDLAIPTPEHFLPLLYSAALRGTNEDVTVFNDQPVAGSLSMTSFLFGQRPTLPY
ncbi:MAG: 4,5-DOPA dioxygenase extradiol [Bacteroidetes bacterium]|nr:4,5-DOPA dioxygenase extradiol [Bacteroidota bacterium]